VPRGEKNLGPLAPSMLRRQLGVSLPDYMTPTTFVELEVLPLTPSGKLDRNALPAPNGADSDAGNVYSAPESEMERVVCRIWEQILELDRVGVHDNFFELGGHSLLLVECHVKLQDALQREFPIVDLFAYPTVSALTNHLIAKQEEHEALTISRDRAQVRS